MSDQLVSRRAFVESLGYAGITTLSLTTLLAFLEGCSNDSNPTSSENSQLTGKKLTLNLSENIELQQVGGFKTVQLGSTPAIVFRTGDSVFVALSLVCTHQGCTVNWQSSANKFKCPCHGSEYDSNGNVTKGPAALQLTKYTTEYQAEANKLIVFY